MFLSRYICMRRVYLNLQWIYLRLRVSMERSHHWKCIQQFIIYWYETSWKMKFIFIDGQNWQKSLGIYYSYSYPCMTRRSLTSVWYKEHHRVLLIRCVWKEWKAVWAFTHSTEPNHETLHSNCGGNTCLYLQVTLQRTFRLFFYIHFCKMWPGISMPQQWANIDWARYPRLAISIYINI